MILRETAIPAPHLPERPLTFAEVVAARCQQLHITSLDCPELAEDLVRWTLGERPTWDEVIALSEPLDLPFDYLLGLAAYPHVAVRARPRAAYENSPKTAEPVVRKGHLALLPPPPPEDEEEEDIPWPDQCERCGSNVIHARATIQAWAEGCIEGLTTQLLGLDHMRDVVKKWGPDGTWLRATIETAADGVRQQISMHKRLLLAWTDRLRPMTRRGHHRRSRGLRTSWAEKCWGEATAIGGGA